VEDTTISLTPSLLEKLEKGTFKMHGIKALKKLVNAFKSACHLADADQDENKSRDKKYEIESSEVFDRLMVLSLTRLHEEFHYHLLGKESTEEKGKVTEKDDDEDDDTVDPNKPINPKLLEKSPRWVDIKPILFTFLKASMHILSEAKEPDLVVFVLKSLAIYIPYMTPFPRIAESMLKTLTALWSAPIDSSEDYQVVRLHAFLRIRQLAMTQPFPFIEEGLKKLYLAYAQRAKFATASSVSSALPTLTFMGNCVVELYSLDYHSAYQHAFIYIRQLALHLRTAMHKKTPEALSAVYCWQYLHCLKLWVAVLTEACQGEEGAGASGEEQLLRSLLFPLSQVILGTVRLIPSTRYLPLRLHCVRLLQQLAAAAEIFLPTTSILLDVFDLRELSQPPKKINKSNVQPLAITLKLRADNPLRTMEELEMCISEVFILLSREIDLYQYSAGFPEFSVRICQRLRKVRMVGAVPSYGYSC
jgi:nucleolar complex protein 2